MRKIFSVEGLGLWDANAAKFVDKIYPDDDVSILDIPEGENKLEALKSLLEFEGYPVAELTSNATKLEILINQNKDFLINMLILSSLDVEIPDAAAERHATLKSEIAAFSDSAKLNLLRS